MQALVSLPNVEGIQAAGGDERSLRRQVAGIPLLTRVLTTARRAGCSSILLLRPEGLPESWLGGCLNSPLLVDFSTHTVVLQRVFDPQNSRDRQVVAGHLEDRFLWLPWNQIPDRKLLSGLIRAGQTASGPNGTEGPLEAGRGLPAVCVKETPNLASPALPDFNREMGTPARFTGDALLKVIPLPAPPGLPAHSKETAREAERQMVRRSGKDSDGMYSKFNRWLSRPAVYWLAKTPVTPNAVTFGGLLVAVLSAVAFAQGYWGAYVLGALLYFASVLFDEIDGMLARITFRESAFGCWLETFVDYATYFILFVGMTLGLYRQGGTFWLWTGGSLLVGAAASFFVLSKQRKLATDPGRPQEYRKRLHRRLEADSANIFSRFARLVEPLVRKPAFCHYLVIFTALGGMKVIFLLCALGANCVWMFALSFNRFFRRPLAPAQGPMETAVNRQG